METIELKNTYKGQTAGGIIRTAEVCKMQAGNVEIVVKDRDGYELVAMIGGIRNGWGETIQDVLCISEVSGVLASLRMSNAAYRKMRRLEKQCCAMK